MTLITLQDGKLVMRDGKVGTERSCCCDSGTGACCYAEGACPRVQCDDVFPHPEAGYWVQMIPPGRPGNTRPAGLHQCEFIEDDFPSFFSDGCFVYREQDLQSDSVGLCGGPAWGWATVWACELNGTGVIGRCESDVDETYCDSKQGFFFSGETCEDKELVNGEPGCGLDARYYPFPENEFP